MKDHQQFFMELLGRTAKAYESSDVKSKNLFYSVCSTPFYQNSTLILGFNWGAGERQDYEPQSKMETKTFTQLDLGSLKRTLKFFHKYLPNENQDEFVQSNLCFFRSKKEHDINLGDLKLSFPLFDSFVEYLQPKTIVAFSARIKDYFANQNKLTQINEMNISSGKIKLKTTKAILNLRGNTVPIYFLPHPNYPISSEARIEAWEHCFGKK